MFDDTGAEERSKLLSAPAVTAGGDLGDVTAGGDLGDKKQGVEENVLMAEEGPEMTEAEKEEVEEEEPEEPASDEKTPSPPNATG